MNFEATTYFTCYFQFDPLGLNPTLPSKNIMQRGVNLGLKWLNCAKKKFEYHIKNFIYYNPW